MISDLKTRLSEEERYKGFKVLDKPIAFNELFKDQNLDLVQLHNVGDTCPAYFCGIFAWKQNQLIPLDGDSYFEGMNVLAYEFWKNKNGTEGLDILVDGDW